VRPGHAKILIDHVDTLTAPAERKRPLMQSVLTARALAVLADLAQCRLTDVQIRIAAQVVRGHA
jgi:hypothetical protein